MYKITLNTYGYVISDDENGHQNQYKIVKITALVNIPFKARHLRSYILALTVWNNCNISIALIYYYIRSDIMSISSGWERSERITIDTRNGTVWLMWIYLSFYIIWFSRIYIYATVGGFYGVGMRLLRNILVGFFFFFSYSHG